MTNYKKYPHVPCRSIHLRMDRILQVLECHFGTMGDGPCTCEQKGDGREDLEELRKVIAYRGNVLSVQKRRGRFQGEYMTITRETGA